MRNAFYTSAKKSTRERPGLADCVSDSVLVNPVHDSIILHKQVMRAIDRLPTQFREMLILVVMLGESYENAARICGCAVGTVKSRVNRARNLVIAELEKGGIDVRSRLKISPGCPIILPYHSAIDKAREA